MEVCAAAGCVWFTGCMSYECFRRCCWHGSNDSENWKSAELDEEKEILRHCQRVLGAYADEKEEIVSLVKEEDPSFTADHVTHFEKPSVEEKGACPPFYICLDHKYKEIAVYIRGLHLGHKNDYITLMNNKKGEKKFNGGYVHHGIWGAAEWAMNRSSPILKELLSKNQNYRLKVVGHSLGAGIAALLTVLLFKNATNVGIVTNAENSIRGFSLAPARVLSFDLSVEYSKMISSVIYQDDFLPRSSTSSVRHIAATAFAFTGLILFGHCMRQACYYGTDQTRVPRSEEFRLYPPGKLFHAVYKKPNAGLTERKRIPLQLRTSEPVKDGFKQLVLSASAIFNDHSVLRLARHLKTKLEEEGVGEEGAPTLQSMER